MLAAGIVVTTLAGGIASGAEGFDLQGHRGARGLAPENTLAAFRKALEIGVTTLELDLGMTRTGCSSCRTIRCSTPTSSVAPTASGSPHPGRRSIPSPWPS